jgi:hypothetical protein
VFGALASSSPPDPLAHAKEAFGAPDPLAREKEAFGALATFSRPIRSRTRTRRRLFKRVVGVAVGAGCWAALALYARFARLTNSAPRRYDIPKLTQQTYGQIRAADEIIDEGHFIGKALGEGMNGYRPIVELMNTNFGIYGMAELSSAGNT